MSLRKFGIGAGVAAAVTAWAGTALALPENWGINFQPANSPVMERIENFPDAKANANFARLIASVTPIPACKSLLLYRTRRHGIHT